MLVNFNQTQLAREQFRKLALDSIIQCILKLQ